MYTFANAKYMLKLCVLHNVTSDFKIRPLFPIFVEPRTRFMAFFNSIARGYIAKVKKRLKLRAMKSSRHDALVYKINSLGNDN